MADERGLARLRILADKNRIFQRPQDAPWPSAHYSVFHEIETLSNQTFQQYHDGRGGNEHWRRKNKIKATWLVQTAVHLSRSAANESTWRMGVENAIFERFSVEVACPNCKNRLWRSEVEPVLVESTRMRSQLDRRRLKRESCACPLEERPEDRYEAGISKLFEDRNELTVTLDDPSGELPKKKPDRIVGLAHTTNFRRLLDQTTQPQGNTATQKIRDLIRCSPLKDPSNPVLFPFLLLEAKSESSPRSFSDIQTQTAFPLRALLDLQYDLRSRLSDDSMVPKPLVWFLGYRGCDWKIYGCYLDCDSASRVTYNIHYLQGGDITTRDGALKLLLLIDFLVDWARDHFRPSIMLQLQSLATGRAFDEISLPPDSDIFSTRRSIVDWASQSDRNTVQLPDHLEAARVEPVRESHTIRLPRTDYGVVRSASKIHQQLAGLRITVRNIQSLLALVQGHCDIDPELKEYELSLCARKLLDWITRWDQVLVVLGMDLDNLEHIWTERDRTTAEEDDEGSGAEFYTIVEYRCFFDTSFWLIRELSYIAISKSAFVWLVKKAEYKRWKPKMLLERICPTSAITDAIRCLRSGSPWQVLQLAISSTLITLCPDPVLDEEDEEDDVPVPVECLTFSYSRRVRVRAFIQKYMKAAERTQPKKRRADGRRVLDENQLKAQRQAWTEMTRARSFAQTYRRILRTADVAHEPTQCRRCKASKQDIYGWRCWDKNDIPSQPANDAMLVSATNESERRHHIALFVFDNPPWSQDRPAISVIAQELAQSGYVYHTLLHDPKRRPQDKDTILHNLPSPYRRTTERQNWDINRWTIELNGADVSDWKAPKSLPEPWTHQQMLLYFLRNNMSYEHALAAVGKSCDDQKEEYLQTTMAPPQRREAFHIGPEPSLSRFWSAHKTKKPSREPRSPVQIAGLIQLQVIQLRDE